MADYYITRVISECKSEEELDAVMEIFNSDGRDVNLNTLALETRARIVSEKLKEEEEMQEMMEALISDDPSLNIPDLMDELDQTGGRMAKRIYNDDEDGNDNVLPSPKRLRTFSVESDVLSTASPPAADPLYRIDKVSEVNVHKFKTRGMNYDIQFNNIDASGVDELHPVLEEAFDGMIDDIVAGMPGHDQVGMVLHTTQLDNPIELPFMRRDQLTANHILSRVEQVLQSHETFSLDETVHVNFYHVSMPTGTGRS